MLKIVALNGVVRDSAVKDRTGVLFGALADFLSFPKFMPSSFAAGR
ncbi:MAG: hypothetical protein JST38_10595 [Bacteroidetes bacterium]|nr:hypothetical protein [Bacteroidota bacterium]